MFLSLSFSLLDLSPAVTEVTNTRHRCYVVALTLNLPPNHFHLRIAGAVPARNKMLNSINPFDPAGYEILQVPQVLRLAEARLSDGTLVRPLSTEYGRIYLTLSGILIAGDVYDRYIIHRHLVDLGLAGPTAPVLSWSSRVLPPIADRGVLHFWALTDLPAELLAISYPTTSRAFDSAPTMTLQQWEEWRQRRTCRVVMTAWSDDTTLALWPALLMTRVQWPSLPNMESDIMGWIKVTIPACYQAIRQAWRTLVDSVRSALGQAPVVPPWRRSTCLLSRLPCVEVATPSHASGSTELRMLPADRKIARTAEKRARQVNSRSDESSSLIPDAPQITCKRGRRATMRPLVVIKGCLPKGYYLPSAYAQDA